MKQAITMTSPMPLSPKLRASVEACPAPNPKWLGGMLGKARRNIRATVWVFTHEARERGADIDEAWAISHTPAALHAPGSFNPAEINIRPEDVAGAIGKWEAVAGEDGVCRVTYDYRPGYDPYNTVSGACVTQEEKDAERARMQVVRAEMRARIAERQRAV